MRNQIDQIYVVQQPNSATNPTDKYRVVVLQDWLDRIGWVVSSMVVQSEHSTYESAVLARDALNQLARSTELNRRLSP